MKKTLVAYFSASGVTKKYAEKIQKELDCEIFEIVPKELYTEKDLDWHDKKSRSSIEMDNKSFRPEVSSKYDKMDEIDKIILGFPIWWYVAPTIVNTFLENYNLEGKEIVIFGTSGSSFFGKTKEELEPSAKGAKIIEGKILTKLNDSELEEFIKTL